MRRAGPFAFRLLAHGATGELDGDVEVPADPVLRFRPHDGPIHLPSASQCSSTFLLGCTRGGSPGIFG